MQYIAVLGRQPEFGLAELESLLGSQAITPIGGGVANIAYDHTIPFARFGSVIKFAKVHQTIDTPSAHAVVSAFYKYIASEHPYEQGVKLKIGISDYSKTFSRHTLGQLGLTLKKELKKEGYSVRIVPNKSPILGSAQVIHNNLTAPHGIEFVMFKQAGALHYATSVYEQDIEAYTARDQARPMRDARVGMLPPKLAQTIINLATGKTTDWQPAGHTVLDPFCGTGVILQEALLMGYDVYGTDLEPRMIDYSQQNLLWLTERNAHIPKNIRLQVGDASSYTWQAPLDFIAAETYLGRPLTGLLQQSDLVDLVQSVNTLHKKVLINIHSQISANTRLCLAVPAWRTKKGFAHLPILDQLDKMGYNRIEFTHAKAKDLIYIRDNQFVGRELVVLQKN
ncbi:MAG TPA: DNA methyltransferase [Candidatus Saccharibacteria bacterium]|nr:DNA methyltransferase [Candidatus Saccharibacteria bacterium]